MNEQIIVPAATTIYLSIITITNDHNDVIGMTFQSKYIIKNFRIKQRTSAISMFTTILCNTDYANFYLLFGKHHQFIQIIVVFARSSGTKGGPWLALKSFGPPKMLDLI